MIAGLPWRTVLLLYCSAVLLSAIIISGVRLYMTVSWKAVRSEWGYILFAALLLPGAVWNLVGFQ